MNSSATEASVPKGLPPYSGTKHISFDGVNDYGQVAAGENFFHAVGTTGGVISLWFKSADVFPSADRQANYLLGAFTGTYPFFRYFYVAFQRHNNANHLLIQRKQLHFSNPGQNINWGEYRSTSAVSVSDDTWPPYSN